MQGRNHGENLDATSAMVGRICPLTPAPLVGIGLMYLKIYMQLQSNLSPCGYIPVLQFGVMMHSFFWISKLEALLHSIFYAWTFQCMRH
jgi:hypothetical protein